MSSVSKTSKPPYLMGLLGLIPLIGFFVGAGLTLYGIFRYKSRKLIFIGIACMIFTVIIYLTLYYIGFKSEFAKKGWQQLGQMTLNSLIKNIEFYKLETGRYPDSLQQLQGNNEFVTITDPTQTTQGRKNLYFNYKNLGTHYLLFSSSTDGIPNTKDDLYPQFESNQNIGWVKSE